MKITKEQLKNIVRETLQEESEYQTFFKKALEKAGKSIPSMSDEEKKAFFNKIEKTWQGRGQKSEGNAFGAAVAKAKKDGDDSFEVDGKEYKTERFGRGHEGPTFGSEEESVNEARTVSKPIKVDNDTMVQIVGDNKGFRELTAALNPKTGKPIQKFGFDRGNETAKSKEELIKKLQKKYGKSIKFESVNEGKKRFKRQDGIGKAKYTISYHDGKKKHKDGSDFFDIKIFKNKKDLSDFVGSLVKQGYKLTNESVNEDRNSNMFYVLYQKKGVFGKPAAAGYKDRKDAEKFAKSLGNNHNTMILDKQSMKNVKGVDVNESASKEAMGIAALTGTRGSAVQDFIDKNRINSRKLFNALKKANLQGRINFASALSGKPNNPNAKLTVKLFGEDKKEVIAFRKKAKSEKAFYDILDKVEKKYGRGVFEKWLDKSLKDLKINPKKYRTSAEKQEALYQAKF